MFRMRPGATGMIDPGVGTVSTEHGKAIERELLTLAAITTNVFQEPDIDGVRSFGRLLLSSYLLPR